MVKGVICCPDAASLRVAGAGFGSKPGPAALVVHVRALALPSMFPNDLQQRLTNLPYPIACAVASPEAAGLGLGPCTLGDTLVVIGGQRVGMVPRHTPDLPAAVIALLHVGWGIAKPRAGFEAWEGEDEDVPNDPFEILGVSPGAAFEDVRAAWRARLAEYHPDKYAQAGPKIRAVAADESRRLNAAYARIAANVAQGNVPKV